MLHQARPGVKYGLLSNTKRRTTCSASSFLCRLFVIHVPTSMFKIVLGFLYFFFFFVFFFFVVPGSAAGAFEPDFVIPLENVTIPQGRDATFTCVVNNLGGYRVSGETIPARVCIKGASE